MDLIERSFRFEAIGTSWSIDITDPLSVERANILLENIKARIELFDRAYSRFREDSLVTEMSTRTGVFELPEDAALMMRLYEQLYHITKGAMTPLIGQVLVEAGYDANYSLQPKELHHPPTWEDTLVFSSPSTLEVKQPIVLDVGAMGKGYLIDLVVELLLGEGVRSFCVEAGGDMRQCDAVGNSLRVGLEHPDDATQVVGVVEINNVSVCGSAGNRRKWSTFHHIINPHTLTSPRDILAIWAVAKTTMLADAMTTALFFAPPEVLLKYYAFEYVIMYADYTAKISKGFPGEVFLKEDI
ncbi:FAD:protein FMN transferase [Patescibacteria group bacterium]|nr:FAD:protein FMN transferase [Patescibacteria group bacterium]MBP9709546.1 FAD:protein FMN transferase [Patescibacteria group bacterium]